MEVLFKNLKSYVKLRKFNSSYMEMQFYNTIVLMKEENKIRLQILLRFSNQMINLKQILGSCTMESFLCTILRVSSWTLQIYCMLFFY